MDGVMSKWKEMAVIHEIPEGWESDCSNCNWFLERYDRADCYLFTSLFDGQFHVLNRIDAKEREIDGDTQWEDS